MGRREMREHIFKLLFMQEFNTPEEMPEQVQLYFETLEELSPAEEAYMQDKYAKILKKMKKASDSFSFISDKEKKDLFRKEVMENIFLESYQSGQNKEEILLPVHMI